MKLFSSVTVAVIAQEAVSVLENLQPGRVRAVVVDIGLRSSIADAAQGCDVAYLVPPARDDKVELMRSMVGGVKDAGLSEVAVLSSLGADAGDKVRCVARRGLRTWKVSTRLLD